MKNLRVTQHESRLHRLPIKPQIKIIQVPTAKDIEKLLEKKHETVERLIDESKS